MSVLTLAKAKTHLNITVTTYDTELQEFIDSAEDAIEAKCGPLTSVAKTERVQGGRKGLVLRHTPVVSLTSVTPVGGTAYDVTLLTAHPAGVVEWLSGATWSIGLYDVAYQAGRAAVPDDLMMGIKELVRHMWESQRGGKRRPGTARTDDPTPPSPYVFIYRVTELINPHVQVGN